MNLPIDEHTRLGKLFQDHVEYLETRISLLNRRACLHKDEPCGQRARNVITGMVEVINVLGFEVMGNWGDYDCYFRIVHDFEVDEAANRKKLTNQQIGGKSRRATNQPTNQKTAS